MLKLVAKKILTFSAMVAFGFALLLLDPDSPSLISEAYACDPFLFDQCYQNCGFACYSYAIPHCHPDWCDCPSFCYNYCLIESGCG